MSGHVAGGNLKGTSGHRQAALSGGGTAVSDPVHCPGKAGRIAGVFLLRNGSGMMLESEQAHFVGAEIE